MICDLQQQMPDRQQDFFRFKAGNHCRHFIFFRKKGEAFFSDNRCHMTGAQKPLHPEPFHPHQRSECRFHSFQHGENRKIGYALLFCRKSGSSSTRSSRLKTDTEKNHFFPRVLLCQFHRISRGIDYSDLCSESPSPCQIVPRCAAGNPNHITIGRKNYIRAHGKRQNCINVCRGCHTNRASWSRQELHPFRKHTPDPAFCNCHGMRSAYLHEADFLFQGKRFHCPAHLLCIHHLSATRAL